MKTPNEKTIQEIIDAAKSKNEPFLVPARTDEFLSYRQCIRENLRLEMPAPVKVYRVNKNKTCSNQLISTLKLAQQN